MSTRASLKGSPRSRELSNEDPGTRRKCDLCGLFLRRSHAELLVDGVTFVFCCAGCKHVFEILYENPEGRPSNYRETELFRACLDSGIIPHDEEDLVHREGQLSLGGEDTKLSEKETEFAHAHEFTFKVDGMWCTACAWLIETAVKRIDGVLAAEIFFLSDMARVKYRPEWVGAQDIMAKVSTLGYRFTPLDSPEGNASYSRDILLRLGVSAVLTINLMMISFALYLGFFQDFSQKTIAYLSYPIWLFATPVVFYGGFPILKRAVRGLRYLNTSMDTLIAIGVVSAYGYSLIELARGGLHLYFDTAAMLVTLVLIGKYIETRARDRVSIGVTELYRLFRHKVRLWDGSKERWVSPDAVKPGDELIVREDERLPVDGEVAGGQANLDESVLTGESRPVRKKTGEEVMAGTFVIDGELQVKATRVGQESTVGQMIRLMQEAINKKNPMEHFADRLMRLFVPAILVIAASTATYLWVHGATASQALTRALTVLVITCPCALGIAVPLAKVASVGMGRARGILVQDPAALEKAKDLDVILFDKTGTLTQGRFALRQTITWGVTEEEGLKAVASVESHSRHFLARELFRKTQEMSLEVEPAKEFEAYEGLGVSGMIQGVRVFVGNKRLMGSQHLHLSSAHEQQSVSWAKKGATVVYFGWKDSVRGFMAFGDSLKRDAKKVVQDLQSGGLNVWLVSGDTKETTEAVAEDLGIRHFRGQVLPDEKVSVVKELQSRGHLVGMVGDGINDAAALAQADVGFALGAKVSDAQEASDILLMTEDPVRVIHALRLSCLTGKTIRRNLFFAFIYNILAVPLAVTGIVNPLVAVFAMFASSLTVVANTTISISSRRELDFIER